MSHPQGLALLTEMPWAIHYCCSNIEYLYLYVMGLINTYGSLTTTLVLS